MISSIIQTLRKIEIQPNMSEQEKKRQKIYDLLYAETKTKFLGQRTFFFTEKELFKEKGSEGFNKKRKEGFLTALTTVNRKEPATTIRKHANELKVSEKSVKTAIK